MTDDYSVYMWRCIELAKLGAGNVAPNPMVGAVLVYDGRIIGEGYHQQYGQAHSEVNCLNSVSAADKHLIKESTLFVSLEPCAHFGKTPPCADLIIKNQIPKVVVGCRDPFNLVDGKGIERLKAAGVLVTIGLLENECIDLNRRFFTFHQQKRPFVILKWAQSNNGQIANADRSPVHISNDYSNRLVHLWRSEEAAILVGTNTAWHDNPSLNVRHWTGKNPVRMVVDLNLRLPNTLNLFNQTQRSIIFNAIKHEETDKLMYYKLENISVVDGMLAACHELKIQSILVEGGTILAQQFIDAGMWDEARVIENTELIIQDGYAAPILKNHSIVSKEFIASDSITYYKNNRG